MKTKLIVKKLTKKYSSNDPFTLAAALGITIIYQPLGKTIGFCLTYKREKIIVINNFCPEELIKFAVAHELGHALLHKSINTQFLSTHTFFSVDRIEREANKFAVELLLPDEVVKDHQDMNCYDLARCYGVPEGLQYLKEVDI